MSAAVPTVPVDDLAETNTNTLIRRMEAAGATVTVTRDSIGSRTLHLVVVAWEGYRLYRSYVPLVDTAIESTYREFAAIQEMRAAGYEVRLDVMSSRAHRVRVSHKHGRDYAFFQATTSTSGYPVLQAYDKWRTWLSRVGGVTS